MDMDIFMATIYSIHHLHIETNPQPAEDSCASRYLICSKGKAKSLQAPNHGGITRRVVLQRNPTAQGGRALYRSELVRNRIQIPAKAEKLTMSSDCVTTKTRISLRST